MPDLTIHPVALIDQYSRFLLRLLDGVSPTLLRYSDTRRLARSLRRVKLACDKHLSLLEEVK